MLSEEGVAGGNAKVLHNEDEIQQALDAASSAENQDDSREGNDNQEAAAAVVS